MKKTLILISVLVIVAVLALITINILNTEDYSNMTVKIGALQGPTAIGMLKMLDEKPELVGAKTEYEIIKSTDAMTAKLQSKELDIACLPLNLAANMYNKGLEYQLLGINVLNNIYLVGTSEKIQDINELKGKTIYVLSKGTTPDILFRYILKQNGIDADKDLKLEYSMQQTEIAQAMISNKIEYAVVPEPFVSQILNSNSKTNIIMDIQDEFNKSSNNVNILQGSIVVNAEFAKNNKRLVDKFVEEYKKSIEFVNSNTQAAFDMSKEYSLGLTDETAKTAIDRSNLVYLQAQENKVQIKNYLSILNDFAPNSIGNKIPEDSFYYEK